MDWKRAALLAGSAVVAGIYAVAPVSAQPAGDRVLSRATATESGRCTILDIRFNYPLRISSTFPVDSGNQVQIRLQPADGASDSGVMTRRETLPAPRSSMMNVRDIEYEGNGLAGPTLTIYFLQGTYFRIGQSPDFQTLIVALSGTTPDPNCTPLSEMKRAVPPPAPATPEPLPMGGAPNALLDEARTAIAAKDYETAIRLLTKLQSEPENPATQDGQELIGIARERNGQLAHAKAEYEDYLRRYPMGEGADRVRQRLAALLRAALSPQRGTPGGKESAPGEPAQARWYMRGSLSEYFYHDQMKTVVNDDINHVVIDNGFTTLQSQLVSSLDTDIGVDTDSFQGKLRVAVAHNKDFLTARNDQTLVAQLYFEGANSTRSIFGRIGRQYRSAGGLYGRFDGFLLSYQPIDHIRTDIIAGFPVDSSRSSFSTKRLAYGASVAYLNGP